MGVKCGGDYSQSWAVAIKQWRGRLSSSSSGAVRSVFHCVRKRSAWSRVEDIVVVLRYLLHGQYSVVNRANGDSTCDVGWHSAGSGVGTWLRWKTSAWCGNG
jgi:hypothetical protein